MGRAVSEAGRKGLALLVLLVAAYVLFKVVLSVATFLVWVVVAVVALAAVVWAVRTL